MGERFPTQTVERPENNEQESKYDNEVVAGFADLADLATVVLKREREAYAAQPEEEKQLGLSPHEGVSLADVTDLMRRRYPDADEDEVAVKGARLFNRIAMEVHGMPEPEDMSWLDTSSSTVRTKSSDVMAYALQHAADHSSDPQKLRDLMDEKLTQYTSEIDGDDARRDGFSYQIQKKMSTMGFMRNSRKYPNTPDYI